MRASLKVRKRRSTMSYKVTTLVGIFGSGLLILTGQQPNQSRVFTSAQAEAGRATYERTCGKCHTPTLLGRNGDKGELPPISFLSASYQKFIGSRGFVPPLAGKVFLERGHIPASNEGGVADNRSNCIVDSVSGVMP